MTGLVGKVRCKVDCRCIVKGKLIKDGCRVVMTGAPTPNLVVDFDKPGAPLMLNEKRCDYLFVAEGNPAPDWVVVLELKGGALDAGQVVEQLRAGALAAEKLVGPKEAVRFRPIVIGKVTKYERPKLKENVKFHKHEEPIRWMSCGGELITKLR